MATNFEHNVNRFLNKEIIKKKVFCIGLHKTGTKTLQILAHRYGFRAMHSIHWINDHQTLANHDFFSDGGSHFDGQHEFDYEDLLLRYPQAKFILQTRSVLPWILSKLKHAGWTENTEIQVNDPGKITHDQWTYKSLLSIQKFIEHKLNYEDKVKSFFNDRAPSQFLSIDITQPAIQHHELLRFKRFLGIRSFRTVKLLHGNKSQTGPKIPPEAHKFISKMIRENTMHY